MKKGLFLLLFFLFFIVFSQVFKSNTLSYELNNKSYKLLLADSPEEYARGLMYVRKLNGADGMIFIFPDKQKRNFWNKNTLTNLDIYWLDDDKVVGKSFLPSIEQSKKIVTVSSPKPVNKVIELLR